MQVQGLQMTFQEIQTMSFLQFSWFMQAKTALTLLKPGILKEQEGLWLS